MQDLFYLHIEGKDLIEFEALGIFSEDIMRISGEIQLPNWWDETATFTRGDYIEQQEIMDGPIDPEKAASLPEERQYFHTHEEHARWLGRLYRHLKKEQRSLRRHYNELIATFGTTDFFGAPKNFKLILKDLAKFEREVKKAQQEGLGFHLEVKVDY